MPDTETHVREHHSVLAAVEKRALVAIARRLPARINADHLSLLAIVAMLVGGAAFWLAGRAESAGLSSLPGTPSAWLTVAIGALAVNWFGDSLDGTVARVRNQQRPRYGYYIDHVLDLAGVTLLFGGMGLSPYMGGAVALALLAAYAMVSAESYLATHVRGVFKMSFLGVGPTELRLLLAAGIVRVAVDPTIEVAGRELLFFDVAGAAGAAALGGAFVVAAVRNATALYAREPLP